jgi:hypothetical protein
MSQKAVGVLAFSLLLVLPLQSDAKIRELQAATYSAEVIKGTPFVAWYGQDETMTVERFVSYCAPILWFSPDEPLLEERTGRDILIPEAFPFEDDPGRPVVYYRLRRLLHRGDEVAPVYLPDETTKAESTLQLRSLAGVDLDFFFYYSREEGLNAHQHDVESVELKVAVARGETDDTKYAIAVTRTKGKAHGVLWYDNTLESDAYTTLPVNILVEEAKHASCPDKNADGMYTPGYDVNTRINDAWGVRDIIRSGGLFVASWQSWMAKIRLDDTRVFPPLPDDSPRKALLMHHGEYAPANAVYVLRPFPNADRADEHLHHFIADKGFANWPEIDDVNSLERFGAWVADESFVKSYSLALRLDGDVGVSLQAPFWLVNHLEDPLAGGYVLHRVYAKGHNLAEVGYTALYTPSASRWMDPYFALGFEHHRVPNSSGGTRFRYDFQFESGFKFRVNVVHTPLKFVRKLGTDFWGLRVGIRNYGGWTINELGYVMEFGAGSF